jgi:hypothetical protein
MKIVVPPDPDRIVRVKARTHSRLLELSRKFQEYCAANPDKYPLSMAKNISISDTIEMLLNLVPGEWKSD